MDKRKEKLSQRIGKTVVEMFCVVMICTMVIGAVNVLVENSVTNNVTVEQNTYIVYGYVEHPYVMRPVGNAAVVFQNLRTNETNMTYTDGAGFYSADLDSMGISHEQGDKIKIQTYYLQYTKEKTVSISGNSSHQINVKLENNNHRIPGMYDTDFNFTEPELPDFENYTYPENSTKHLPN